MSRSRVMIATAVLGGGAHIFTWVHLDQSAPDFSLISRRVLPCFGWTVAPFLTLDPFLVFWARVNALPPSFLPWELCILLSFSWGEGGYAKELGVGTDMVESLWVLVKG